MTQVREAGEQGIIGLIHRLQTAPPPGYLGIGDDAAFLPPTENGLLVSQDMLVEGIHFRWDWSTPQQVGEKAVAVNLSDIAAMGGEPRAILTSLALPPTLRVEVVEDLYVGMAQILDQYGTVLVGGDTVASPDRVVLDVTVLGTPGPHGPISRRGARPGDRVFISGRVGASYAGYTLLSHGVEWPGREVDERSVLTAHLLPIPRLSLGRELGSLAHAMTDISDGLYQEFLELTRFGAIGMDIDADRLPVDQATRHIARRFESDVLDYSLHGGEDYELLVVVPSSRVHEMSEIADKVGVPLTEVGVVTDRTGIAIYRQGHEVRVEGEHGFEHFRAHPDTRQ